MTRLQLITSEVASKGKCYIICLAYNASDFAQTLANACAQGALLGAHKWYLTFRTSCCSKANSIGINEEFRVERIGVHACAAWTNQKQEWVCADIALPEGWAMQCYCEFHILSKRLQPEAITPNPLHMKPLRVHTAELFCALYNEAFFDVPNATTMTQREIAEILQNVGDEAGFIMLGGMPVGTFLLKFYKEQPAEIAILGIQPSLWGQGYGQLALRMLTTRLLQKGAAEVQLLSASTNQRAEKLYRANGFSIASNASTWYEVLPKTQDIVGETGV